MAVNLAESPRGSRTSGVRQRRGLDGDGPVTLAAPTSEEPRREVGASCFSSSAWGYFLRLRIRPSGRSPRPSSESVPGSGTDGAEATDQEVSMPP